MGEAWIGFAGAIIAALIGAVAVIRQSRKDGSGQRLGSDLDMKAHEGTALLDRDLHPEHLLERYREPLAAAAFDLQSRLYNILCLGFLERYPPDTPRGQEVIPTTLFRLAEYFGCTEILRRKVRFLSFPEDERTRRFARLQSDISNTFVSSSYGPALMIWADEQRALGERMIVEEHGDLVCMGYAAFSDRCADLFAPYVDRLRTELVETEATDRMRDAQHLLCELVETLDERRVRYVNDLERA